jgi:hypothetical protein
MLEDIRRTKSGTIRAAVAGEALDYHDNPATFFTDLQSCGCASGFVGSLIYFADTHAFYDRHYDEIEELREAYEVDTGEAIRIRSDLKNFYAWFAFEEVAYHMATDELDL